MLSRKQVDALAARHKAAGALVVRTQVDHDAAAGALLAAQQAQQIAQAIAQVIQQQAHQRIADVVTRCLTAVFDDPYTFQILFEQRRGRTEATLLFVRDGYAVDPLTASGGGVVDVAAFALRLAVLVLSKPPLRRVLIFDEPFRFVSREYRGRIRLLLEALSAELSVQFIIVTHFEDLQVGKVIEIG